MPKQPAKRLTARGVESAKPGRYHDGHGLCLVVYDSGARNWSQRIMIRGRRVELGLGPTWRVTLAQAREQAIENRAIARAGGDPRGAATPVPTFKAAAAACHAQVIEHLKYGDQRHGAQWLRQMEQHVIPVLGDVPVNQITSAQIVEALQPIWSVKQETSRKVARRISEVWRWGQARGHIDDRLADPMIAARAGLPRQRRKVQPRAAIPYALAPAYFAGRTGSLSALVERWVMLTAVRSSEARLARWCEIDLRARVWTIPGARMKLGVDHVVPLSRGMIPVLREARLLHGRLPQPEDLLFPTARGAPLKDSGLSKTISADGYTIHGHRSAFRDWVADKTDYDDAVAEAALAHQVKDSVVRAYKRTTFFDKRRQLMRDWSRFLTQAPGRDRT